MTARLSLFSDFTRAVLLSAVLLLVLTVSPSARAQNDKAAAEALFREGMRLTKTGNYAEACPKLEESQRLEPSLGVQYYLADCYERIGRSASAWANFAEVANKAKLAGETAKERTSRKRADDLEPKLARLSITVENAKLPGLAVQRGAIALGSGQWGVAVPIDPGSYELRATAPGFEDWTKTVEVKPGASLNEKIPALTRRVVEAAPLAEPVKPAPTEAPLPLPVQAVPTKPVSHVQSNVGIVVGAVGVAALATSGVLALLATSANSSSKAAGKCLPDDTCSTAGLDERDRALRLADAATVVSLAGAVVGATGLVIWLTAPTARSEAPASASAQLRFGPGSFLLRGQF